MKIIESKNAPESVGLYPHARKVGNFLFLSGVGPRERNNKEIPGVILNTNGEIAAQEQTELIDVVEKNIAYGQKVEKTACRGHGDSGGWTGRGGIKLGENISSNLGIDNTFIINKLKIFNDDKVEYLSAPSCPRREPLYSEYKIYGNIVF